MIIPIQRPAAVPGPGTADGRDALLARAIRFRRAGRALRVLVADDCIDAADSLALLLRMWGYDARETYGGADVLKAAAEYRPDVILLDVAMPFVDGCEVARQLRERGPRRPARVIAMTGYQDESHRTLCREAGFDTYLVKPLDLTALEELLALEHERLAPAGPRLVRMAAAP
jgi:two-component system CheB/CheR fusion protein